MKELSNPELNIGIDINWVDAKTFENNNSKVNELKKYDGIIVPGGFGLRDR